MALYVNTNVSSLNAKRNLSNSTSSLDTTYKRLASGLRINSAKDDAAGLQISNRLTSQINGLEQGNRNAQDGISYSQTAEGAMDEITNMLQRVRTLALQSANGTNNAKDRIAIQQEVTQLCNEINRVSVSTTFGGTKILNGDGGITVAGTGTDAFKATGNKAGDKDIVFQVGADANQTIGVDLGLKNGAGFDIAGLTSNLTKADGTAFKQADITADGTGTFVAISAADSSTGKANVAFDVTTADSAQNVLAVIDKYVQTVDSKRAELGAVQNRLESTIRNQSNINENVSDARSRIRDTDFAVETANMSQQNILQQASQTMLSQANQRPQIALSLLQQ
ncbi:MAG: flagellin [Succinivibrionaceae bacterium]|nr:flagellin [Succinivibrionaceae bacterium]